MNKKLILYGIIILLVISISVFALKNKITSEYIEDNYVEECLEYDQIPYNKTLYYCDSNFRYLMMCWRIDEDGNWIDRSSVKEESYDRSEVSCNCPNVAERQVIHYRDGGCTKYHLVRYIS